MNNALEIFGTQIVYISVSLLSFFFVGWPIVLCLGRFTRLVRVLIAILVGVSIIIATTYTLAIFGVNARQTNRYLLICTFLGSIIVLIYKLSIKKNGVIFAVSAIKREFLTMFSLISISIISLLYPALGFFQSGGALASFTMGNNDIGSYIIQAKAISLGGFTGDTFIRNENYFTFTKSGDFGSPALISWISNSTNLNFVESFSITMLVVITIIALALYIIIRQEMRVNAITSMLLVMGVLLSPVHNYLVANNFLAQLIAIAMWLCLIALFLSYMKKSSDLKKRDVVITVTPIVVVLIYSYPHMAPFYLFAITVFILFLRISALNLNLETKEKFEKIYEGLLFAVVPIILFIAPYLKSAVDLLLFRRNSDNGWPMGDHISLRNFVTQADNTSSNYNLAWVLGTLIIFMYSMYRLTKLVSPKNEPLRNKEKRGLETVRVSFFIIQGLIFPIVLYVCLGLVFGMGSYKAWKVLYSFGYLLFPILIYFTLIKRKVYFYVALSSALVIGINSNYFLWSTQLTKIPRSAPLLHTTTEMLEIDEKTKGLLLKSINIDAAPFFESMILGGNVESETIYLNQPTYNLPKFNVYACTLTRYDLVEKNIDYKTAQKKILNKDYLLVNFPGKCF